MNDAPIGKFKEYFEQQGFVDFILENFNSSKVVSSGKTPSIPKKQILQMWKGLRPDVPINITPINSAPGHENYGEDGIRISGSWNFISTVLGRIKDLMMHENPQTRLRLVFRGVDSNRDSIQDNQNFVFYLNLERRKKG